MHCRRRCRSQPPSSRDRADFLGDWESEAGVSTVRCTRGVEDRLALLLEDVWAVDVDRLPVKCRSESSRRPRVRWRCETGSQRPLETVGSDRESEVVDNDQRRVRVADHLQAVLDDDRQRHGRTAVGCLALSSQHEQVVEQSFRSVEGGGRSLRRGARLYVSSYCVTPRDPRVTGTDPGRPHAFPVQF